VRREVLYKIFIEFGAPMKLIRLIKMFNCWGLHPVARVFTNAFLKTTLRNNVSVLDVLHVVSSAQ
jgi:hypothetical protein